MKHTNLLLLLLFSLNTQAQRIVSDHFPLGYPIPKKETIIQKAHYSSGIDTKTKVPIWVGYAVTFENITNSRKQRKYYNSPLAFDSEILEIKDYKKSGYDRGHYGPNATINHVEANYNTNLVPQLHHFNAGIWNKAEQAVRNYAEGIFKAGDYERTQPLVYVISGCVHLKRMRRLPNADEPHEVPSHFFKIIYHINAPIDDINPGDIQVLCLFFDQRQRVKFNLAKYEVKLSELEKLTGKTFLPQNVEFSEEQKIKFYGY